jgi:hypothetical protein
MKLSLFVVEEAIGKFAEETPLKYKEINKNYNYNKRTVVDSLPPLIMDFSNEQLKLLGLEPATFKKKDD